MLAQFFAPVVGGEERVVENLGRELVRRGHEVSLATLEQERAPAFEVRDGIRIHRIASLSSRAGWLFQDPQRPHVPPVPDPQALAGLRRVVEEERPEVVHAHNWLVHSFVPLKRRSGAALVVSLHDYSLRCATKRLMHEGIRPCTGAAPAKCLACSAQVYGRLKGIPTAVANWVFGLPERRAVDMFLPVSRSVAQRSGLVERGLPHRVVPNFIPASSLRDGGDAPPRRPDGLPRGDYLLYAGDLTHDKGVDVLLHAHQSLAGPPPLALIGRPYLRDAHPHARNVHVLGTRPHEFVLDAWRSCAVAVVPSLWDEPFGMVALEAMAAGRPVVASDAGGLRDIVSDGQTGLLVRRGDPAAFAHALRRLCDDPELRARMGRAARRRAEVFRADAVVPLVEEVYAEAARRAG